MNNKELEQYLRKKESEIKKLTREIDRIVDGIDITLDCHFNGIMMKERDCEHCDYFVCVPALGYNCVAQKCPKEE